MPSPTAPAAASSTTTAGDATAAFGGETELEMLITDEGAMEEEGICCASGAGVKSASAEGGAGLHGCAASAASNLSELRLCAPCSIESSSYTAQSDCKTRAEVRVLVSESNGKEGGRSVGLAAAPLLLKGASCSVEGGGGAAHAGAGEALLTTLDMLLWSVVRGGVCEKWWWRGEGAVEKERLRGEVKSLSRASATRYARGVVW